MRGFKLRFHDWALAGASGLILATVATPTWAQTAGAGSAALTGPTAVGEVVVTAQKRQESIQNVGMSIQAASGDKLTKLGLTDTASLQKIVPGFLFTPTYSGMQVFTIRGVGFQDSSLGGSPTVSVYQDEMPLPFSALTSGATLDLQRVEVLKGPQGTLFGENATGGAINYIANKPTDTFQAGGDVSYGRFSDVKLDAFIGGPITDTLDARLAVQTHNSDAWQKGYGPQAGQTAPGGADFLNGRLSLQWKPTSDFTALLTLSAWQDKSYNQFPQLFGIAELNPLAPLAPAILNYPSAPHNAQAAGFNSCVNTSGFDPIAGQAGGSLWGVAGGRFESQGPGSIVQAGGQPTSCTAPRNDNHFYSAQLRMSYDLPQGITLTSLTSYLKFDRAAGLDMAGMPIQDYQTYQRGGVSTVYQELRLAGRFDNRGSWIIGANYEHDSTRDNFLATYNAAANAPTLLYYQTAALGILSNPGGAPGIFQPQNGIIALPLGPTREVNNQDTNTYAVYADAEYPILSNLTLQAGVRFTQEDKRAGVCTLDSGDGTAAAISNILQAAAGSTNPSLPALGGCVSIGSASANFNPPAQGLFYSSLNQNNVSWRAGLNWQVQRDVLLYVNVSKGWKGGSYPTIPASTLPQFKPVTQESLQAYEVGFKSRVLDRQLTANGAFFYYDYTNKQILGAISDPLFGSLPALVNVPQSHVLGFELSGAYAPDWLKGLTITPAVSYQYSEVDSSSKNQCAPPIAQSTPGVPGFVNCVPGHFYNYDNFNEYADFTHESFPDAPRWQASVDAEYDWKLRDNVTAYIGGNINYTSDTVSFFYNRSPTPAFLSNSGSGSAPNFVCYVDAAGACSAGPVGPSPTNHANDKLAIAAHTLVDLRAGISTGDWRFQVWGRNVGNTFYSTSVYHVNDALVRYTGMPATYGITISYRYN